MRRTIILTAALAIIVLGLWGTAVIYFDESRLKGIVADRLSEQLGRRVEIVGALRFKLFPSLRFDAENVVVAGPDGAENRAMMRVQRVSMSLRVLPLLQGELAPGQMQLTGAVMDVSSKGSDDERLDPLSTIRSSARLLSGRSLRLRDLTLLLPGGTGAERRSIRIDFIELDRFSLDRTVAFRFRGDLGDPPLLGEVRVDGMLHVPASPDSPVRLRDMHLQGCLIALDKAVSLRGDLTATGVDAIRLALAGGRLTVGESSFNLSLDYHGGARPAADLLVSGRELDWLALEAFPIEGMKIGLAAALASVSKRVDIRSQLQFDRLSVGALRFADARIDLRSQAAGLGVSVATAFAGGFAEASGVLTGKAPETLAVDVSLAEFGQLLEWLGLPRVVDGSGEATLNLSWPVDGLSGFQLEGQFGLWDGFWQVSREKGEPIQAEFDQFAGEIRMSSGYLEIPAFELRGGDLSGIGWAAVDLPGGILGGEIRSSTEEEGYLALSGTLAQPRLAPATPASAEGDDDSPDSEGDEPDL